MASSWLIEVSYPLTQLVVAAASIVAVMPLARRCDWRPIGLFLGFVFIDTTIQAAPFALKWQIGHWNWIGKSASFLFDLALVRAFRASDEVGLRWPRTRREIGWTLAGIAGCMFLAFPMELLQPDRPGGIEVFLFEATLPGADEEFGFRGIGLALLILAFTAGPGDRRAAILASAVICIWFVAAHVVLVSHGHVAVNWHRVLDVSPFAVWVVVVRLRSGSLLGGIIGHNANNVIEEALGAFGR